MGNKLAKKSKHRYDDDDDYEDERRPSQKKNKKSNRRQEEHESDSSGDDGGGKNSNAPPPEIQTSESQAQRMYREANGKDCNCAEKIRAFKMVTACGVKSWGKGMYVDGLVINGKFFKDIYGASSSILPHLLKGMEHTQIEKTCSNWAIKVLLPFHMVINESEAEINRSMPKFKHVYHRVRTEMKSNGTVVVVLWVRWKEESDEDPDNTYRQFEYVFNRNKDWGVLPPKELDCVVVPIKNRDLVN